MPRHLISDAHEWINEIPTVPIYYLAKPQPRERAWQNQRGKKTLRAHAQWGLQDKILLAMGCVVLRARSLREISGLEDALGANLKALVRVSPNARQDIAGLCCPVKVRAKPERKLAHRLKDGGGHLRCPVCSRRVRRGPTGPKLG